MEKIRNTSLIILTVVFVMQGTTGMITAQEKNGSKTFHTIIFSGVENGEPQMNMTSMTINGTTSELRDQFPQVIDWLFNLTEGISPGPAVFLAPNTNESYVTQGEPTREQHLSYLESELATDGTTTDAACWIHWVGGGSMHGDCPPKVQK
jgi:hypothetical protein